MDILGIAYLGFQSPAHKEWLDYGPSVLGLGLASSPEGDDSVYLRMDDRRWRIAVHAGEQDDLAYIGWEARDRTAFRAGVAQLEAQRVAVVHGDEALAEQRGVREVAQFSDPAGFAHEICYGQKFDPGSFVPGRPHRGFVGGAAGIGHVVIVVADLSSELERFWEETMGFDWFSHADGPFKSAFYRARLSPLSHSIGIIQGPGVQGFHHIGMAVREIDDVGIAYDLVQAREIPLQRTLGRHTQDPVISFYHFTPSGFVIEYLSEGGEPYHGTNEPNPEKLSVWGHQLVGSPIPETVRPVA